MKILTFIIIFIIPFIGSSQNEIKPEWIETDVAIFKHFFDNFPLDSETTINDLMTNLERFKDASHDSIGFDGILYWWILPGGTTSINSHIVTYHGKVAIAETIIYKDYIKGLNRVFEKDTSIREKFMQYFNLQVNPNYFNDSVYIYTFKNDSIFKNYKMHLAEYLGKQEDVDLTQCEFEYNLLNTPTGRYQFESYFRKRNDYPPFNAINKLINENRIDCIKNIIRGYSLPGRMYGTAALLQLAKEKAYKLSDVDKELIDKVLNLNLKVESGYDLTSYVKYRDCINADLLKLIDE